MRAGPALFPQAAALPLAACGDKTRSSASPAGAPVTPAAGDTPAGGSSGNRGMPPVPDSSAGPSMGASSPGAAVGAAPSRPTAGTTFAPEPGSAEQGEGFAVKSGVSAQDTGRTDTQGSANSTPHSSTGNASR